MVFRRLMLDVVVLPFVVIEVTIGLLARLFGYSGYSSLVCSCCTVPAFRQRHDPT